jgi:hypothetical protein
MVSYTKKRIETKVRNEENAKSGGDEERGREQLSFHPHSVLLL